MLFEVMDGISDLKVLCLVNIDALNLIYFNNKWMITDPSVHISNYIFSVDIETACLLI